MGVFHYASRASDEEWLRKKQMFSDEEVNLAICLTENSQHIGNIYLRNIDWIARHAELRIFIGAGPRSNQRIWSGGDTLADYRLWFKIWACGYVYTYLL